MSWQGRLNTVGRFIADKAQQKRHFQSVEGEVIMQVAAMSLSTLGYAFKRNGPDLEITEPHGPGPFGPLTSCMAFFAFHDRCDTSIGFERLRTLTKGTARSKAVFVLGVIGNRIGRRGRITGNGPFKGLPTSDVLATFEHQPTPADALADMYILKDLMEAGQTRRKG